RPADDVHRRRRHGAGTGARRSALRDPQGVSRAALGGHPPADLRRALRRHRAAPARRPRTGGGARARDAWSPGLTPAILSTMDERVLLLGLLWFVAFLFSTTVHEAMHALVAYRGGDP